MSRLLKNDDLFLLSLIDYSPSPPPQIWDLVRSPEFEMSRLLENDYLFLSLIDYSHSPPPRSGTWCRARSLR